MADKMNKKAQIAIFIIVALFLVVGVILLFTLTDLKPTLITGEEFTPESFIDKCLRDSLRETVDAMLPQGGFVNPTDFKVYNDIKVAYLCKNVNYYDPCITQYPRYITRLQEEIEFNVNDDVESCFISLEQELDNRGYTFSGGDVDIDVLLKPGAVELSVDREFSYTKSSSSKSFDTFDTALINPLYELGYVANLIASQESKFCYFEYVGYMALYPDFNIRKEQLSDSTKIYTITDKSSGEEMNIATRGCAIPAGF